MGVADEFKSSFENKDVDPSSISNEFKASFEGSRSRNVTLQAPPGELQFKQDRPIKQNISKFARPILEGGGATVGGIAGLGVGLAIPTVGEEPLTVLAGESLGFAAGKNLADSLDALLGLPTSRTTRTPVQAIEDVPKDILQGAEFSAFGQSIGAAGSALFKKFFGPSKAFTPEKQELVRLAEENNINLTPAEITEAAPLALFESLLDKMISSSGTLSKQHLETLDGLVAVSEKLKAKGAPAEVIELLGNRIIDATNKALKSRDDIANAALTKVKDRTLALLGTSTERATIGDEVQAALVPRSKKAQARVTEKFNKFWRLLAPDEEVTDDTARSVAQKILKEHEEVPIGNTRLATLVKKIAKQPDVTDEEFARRLSEMNLTPQLFSEQPPEFQQQVLEQLDLVEKVPTALAFKLRRQNLNVILQEEDAAIKAGAAGFKGQSSVDAGRAKLLKQALDEDLRAFSTPKGGEVLSSFNEAIASAGRFKSIYGSPQMLKIIRSDPGRVLDTVVGTNSVKEWRVFKKAADAESVEKIRQALVAKLVGDDTTINSQALKTRLARYQPGILKEVLGENTVNSLKKVSSREDAIKSINIKDKLFTTIARRDPGQVFGTIIKRGTKRTINSIDAGNVGRLEQLQRDGILDEVGIERMKARYLEEVFSFNKQDRIPPQSIVNNVTEFGERTKNFLLTAEEVDDLDVIVRLAKAANGAERIAGNPSGTAQNTISFSSLGMIWRHPLKNGLGLVVVPQALAALYTSPVARKLLVEGLSTPLGTRRSAELFARLSAIAASDDPGPPQDVLPAQTVAPPSPQRPPNPTLGGL